MAAKRVFEAMNGIRGVAALVVVIDHCSAFGWFPGELARKFVEYGSLAVDLFFVMSGFVIAHAYSDKLSRGMTTRNFLLTRLVRLYPLYVLGIGIGCITPIVSLVHQGRITDAQIPVVASVPFASAMLPSPIAVSWSQVLYPLNGPAWSLFFELLVNILYAATWRRWTKGNILVVMGLSAAALLWSHDFTGGWNWASLPVGFWRVLYSFPAGVLIYLFYKEGCRIPLIYFPIMVLAFGLCLLLPGFWCKAFAVFAGFPTMIAFSARIEPAGVLASICGKLGAASYAIYAIHDPLLWLANNIWSKFGPGQNSLLLGAAFTCAIIPACLVIDHVFDQPIRSALMRKLRSADNS
jgi:peptidoglycan/LPS O-acetylase OafA/YrhL